MTQKQGKRVVVQLDIRKLKRKPEANLPSLSKAKLEALIEEAVVDAYGDEEKTSGFFTMIEEHRALPFTVCVLGAEAVVEKVDMTRDGRIVAVCQRDGMKQRIEILDLPLPKPAPAGAEWIAAYNYWRKGFRSDPRRPDCRGLSTRWNETENRNPRSTSAQTRTGRRGVDCSIQLLAQRVPI